MSSEKRRAPRATAAKRLEVHYSDESGRDRFEIVESVDLSRTGCRLLLKFRCKARAVVQIRSTAAASGSATVRYQTPGPKGYVTGLEFLGGFHLPMPEAT